jgi:hypothetical protein
MLLQGPTNKFDLKLAIKCLSVGEGDKERERERGISEVRKIEEIYARTKNKVKVGEKEGEWFETTKGVRQGCPLAPCYLRYMWQI